MKPDRRTFLRAAALLALPRVSFAQAATERRFIFIIQRGAADGLHTVIPYADPAYGALRGALAIDGASMQKLDGSFALHPALGELHRLYTVGQATFIHAIASPYRERSHFDAQNVLETGGSTPHQLQDGWMNRLLGLLPRSGKEAIAFAPSVPLAMRGAIEVASYAPSSLPQAGEDLLLRVEQLYSRDAQLHALWSSALDARTMAEGARTETDGRANRQDSAALGRMAARFLARADGPRLAMFETSGWDTHSGQVARLALQLRSLDRLIGGLQEGLGPAWADTVILVATEFGRTVAVNGTRGTDHGTGAVAMLAGGAVQGGRIITDWPGLAPGDLLDGRDLRPTIALDALIATVCAEAFRLKPQRTARALFPAGKSPKPLPQLLRA